MIQGVTSRKKTAAENPHTKRRGLAVGPHVGDDFNAKSQVSGDIRMRAVPVGEVKVHREPAVAFGERFIRGSGQGDARLPDPGDETQALGDVLFAEFSNGIAGDSICGAGMRDR